MTSSADPYTLKPLNGHQPRLLWALLGFRCLGVVALFSTLIIEPVKNARHRLRWSPGLDATSTAPEPATTSDKPANYERHEVRLEY